MKVGDIVKLTIDGWKRYGVVAETRGDHALVVDRHEGIGEGTVGENGWLMPKSKLDIVGYDIGFFWPKPSYVVSVVSITFPTSDQRSAT